MNKTHNSFDMNDAKIIVKTAFGAFQGYKTAGVTGAVAGGYYADREATKNSGSSKP